MHTFMVVLYKAIWKLGKRPCPSSCEMDRTTKTAKIDSYRHLIVF